MLSPLLVGSSVRRTDLFGDPPLGPGDRPRDHDHETGTESKPRVDALGPRRVLQRPLEQPVVGMASAVGGRDTHQDS